MKDFLPSILRVFKNQASRGHNKERLFLRTIEERYAGNRELTVAIMWVTQESLSRYQRGAQIQQERRIHESAAASPVIVGQREEQSIGQTTQKAIPSSPYSKGDRSYPEARVSRVSKVGQLMTSHVVIVYEMNTVDDLLATFRRHDFRHIPVINQPGRLVGVVSELDLISRNQQKLGKLVREVMKSPVLVATVDTLIREAAQVMLDERIGCLPALGKLEKIVGIITRSDILRTVVAQAPLETWA
jgi:CBS domain-containing protein